MAELDFCRLGHANLLTEYRTLKTLLCTIILFVLGQWKLDWKYGIAA